MRPTSAKTTVIHVIGSSPPNIAMRAATTAAIDIANVADGRVAPSPVEGESLIPETVAVEDHPVTGPEYGSTPSRGTFHEPTTGR